ncbi:MAG: hypothetical protein IJT36_04385 [Alphaproteobacteria bacterium]|nr:hypothetical protein [Alphaproteobacteria bacterium]
MYQVVAIRSDFIIIRQDDKNIQMIPKTDCNLNLTVGEEVDVLLDGEKITLIKKNLTQNLLPAPTDTNNTTTNISFSEKLKNADTVDSSSSIITEQIDNSNNNKDINKANKFFEYLKKFIDKIKFRKKEENTN